MKGKGIMKRTREREREGFQEREKRKRWEREKDAKTEKEARKRKEKEKRMNNATDNGNAEIQNKDDKEAQFTSGRPRNTHFDRTAVSSIRPRPAQPTLRQENNFEINYDR